MVGSRHRHGGYFRDRIAALLDGTTAGPLTAPEQVMRGRVAPDATARIDTRAPLPEVVDALELIADGG
jgi:molybdopterin biosynthesis enzyme